jgi:hypothetical protein
MPNDPMLDARSSIKKSGQVGWRKVGLARRAGTARVQRAENN